MNELDRFDHYFRSQRWRKEVRCIYKKEQIDVGNAQREAKRMETEIRDWMQLQTIELAVKESRRGETRSSSNLKRRHMS